MGSLRNLLTGKLPKLSSSFGVGLSSPLGGPTTTIHEMVWADFFQGEIAESTRSAAMQIPAISRARSILVGVISQMPLRAYPAGVEDAEPLPEQPGWLTSTAGPTPLWHRMAWTVDDLLFSGASLWTVTRDGSGQITDAARVQRDRWSIDDSNDEILVDGVAVPANSVLYIPGADEGLLLKGGPSIRGARAIERAWVGRAQNPIPLIELHQLTDEQLEDDEIDELVASFAAGRTSPTGAVGFTDHRVEVRVHGTVVTDLYQEARNASVLDLARHTNMPAALLDGSMSTATLTYSTQEGRANEFADYSLPFYMSPIEARLSQDDVCPEGVAIRFDRSTAVRMPQPVTSPVTDD